MGLSLIPVDLQKDLHVNFISPNDRMAKSATIAKAFKAVNVELYWA